MLLSFGVADAPKNAGIDRSPSIWGDNPRLRNAILLIVAVLLLVRAVTTVWLIEEYWRTVARWVGLPVVPTADRTKANAKLQGNVAQFFSSDSYPDDARDQGEEGLVRAALSVGANGRVSGCRIAASSGHDSLDQATCRVVLQRVRFEPARDSEGRAISSPYPLAVRWQLPKADTSGIDVGAAPHYIVKHR